MNLSFHMDSINKLEFNIPDEPNYTADEVEVWLVCDNGKICVFKDSWASTFLTETVHVVNQFRNHGQHNHYRPEEIELRYFQHLASGKTDKAMWDYLLFSYKCNHVFLAENYDGRAVLIISEMHPYIDNPAYRQLAFFPLERTSFLSWFDCLVTEMEKMIN